MSKLLLTVILPVITTVLLGATIGGAFITVLNEGVHPSVLILFTAVLLGRRYMDYMLDEVYEVGKNEADDDSEKDTPDGQ